MKVSLNSIRAFNKRYSTCQDPGSSNQELIDKIENQLGAIEEIEDLTDKYKGAVIVNVVSVTPHSNAEKLSICLIDDAKVTENIERNKDGLIQVVCGAPNVKVGMSCVWLPPKAIVPSSLKGEALTIEAKDIRGEMSYGMLASPKELDLYDSHEGLLELDEDAKPGQDFAETFNLKNDLILNLENKMFTHRPDCFGLLGIARELSGIEHTKFTSPEWYIKSELSPTDNKLKIKLSNELPNLVPHFMLVAIKGVEIKPSPSWLQIELAKIGMRPINNIVDLTNYYMYLTAQPLHAYDYDKVRKLGSSADSADIIVRNPKPGETLELLSGKTITPRAEAIMIATENKLIGIGGVMGGSETEVGMGTQNIILECASFDMYSIRRTSMEHGLFTDAVTRFTKGQSPLQNSFVLSKAASETTAIAGGQLSGNVIDDKHLSEDILSRNSLFVPVKITDDFINKRLGLNQKPQEIAAILTNVEFECQINSNELEIKSPFWRTDIELREDVVEEVGRLYGYNQLPQVLPARSLTPAITNALLEAKSQIRERLLRAGANEVLTYSFVHEDLIKKVGQDPSLAFKVSNAISPVLQYYRLSIAPSLLEKVHPNIKAGYDKFALFELGKTHGRDHMDDDGLPSEFEYCALVIAASNKVKPNGSSYYEAKRYLEYLLNTELVYEPLNEEVKRYSVVKPYDVNRSALVYIKHNKQFLGIIGEFKPSVSRDLKLPNYCAGFEVDTNIVKENINKNLKYKPLSRFPYVEQDITIKVDQTLSYAQLKDFIDQRLSGTVPPNSTYDITPLDIFVSKDDESHKNISFRVRLSSYERTLTAEQVNSLLDELAKTLEKELGGQRV